VGAADISSHFNTIYESNSQTNGQTLDGGHYTELMSRGKSLISTAPSSSLRF